MLSLGMNCSTQSSCAKAISWMHDSASFAADTVGWFDAIGSFYNLLKHRSDASQPAPSEHSTDAVVGMIDERTKDLPAERRGERRKGFEALFSNGTVSAEREVSGYDLFDFAPTDYPDFKLPADYQGTSGGAVWRICLSQGRLRKTGGRVIQTLGRAVLPGEEGRRQPRPGLPRHGRRRGRRYHD